MKVKLDYTVRTTRAPGEQTDTWVPMIVDRIQPTSLEGILEKCIDHGLIAGIKPTAAKTIADGVAEQMAHEFAQGHGVQFGQYFYGRPYLSGKVDANGKLTSENAIDVRLYKGNAFKLSRDDFSLSYIDGGNNPKIDFLVCDGGTPRGEIVKGKSVKVNGQMLYGAGDTVKVTFTPVDETAQTVVVTTFDAVSANLITFGCPSALVENGKYGVVVERVDENGVTRVSAPKGVTVVPNSSADAPTITGAATAGDEDGVVNVAGGTLEVVGENIETALTIDLLNDQGELWHTVPASYVEGKLTASLDYDSTPSETGSVRVTTAGGSATYEVEYGAH